MIKFTYNGKPYTTPDESSLLKKIKKLGITINDIVILAKNDVEKTNKLPDTDVKWTYHIYQNSKGYYLWGINSPDISYYGIDTSDYKLIDTTTELGNEYRKWNPESKTGDKRYN